MIKVEPEKVEIVLTLSLEEAEYIRILLTHRTFTMFKGAALDEYTFYNMLESVLRANGALTSDSYHERRERFRNSLDLSPELFPSFARDCGYEHYVC